MRVRVRDVTRADPVEFLVVLRERMSPREGERMGERGSDES